MKVADLRQELRSVGLKVSGVKQELVDRLSTHLKTSKSSLRANVVALPPALAVAVGSKPEAIDRVEAPDLQASESTETVAPVHTTDAISQNVQHEPMAVVLADATLQNVQSQIEMALTEESIVAMNTVVTGALVDRVFAEPSSAPSPTPQDQPLEQVNASTNHLHASCALVEETACKEAAIGPVVTSEALQMPSLVATLETLPETSENPLHGVGEVAADHRGCNSRPAVPRQVSRVPLSPTAVLAPEVGGTPSKDGATPVKCQTAWREICAKEAACLRISCKPASEQAATGSPGPKESSRQSSPDSEGESSSEDSTAAKGAIGRSPLSRSRSPYASPEHKQSEPSPMASEQTELATRPRIILKKRRSLVQTDAPTNSTFQWKRSGSRSRSPIQRRQGTPKNCLFSCTPKRHAEGTPSSKGAADRCATPDQLRARARAQELRAELLKRRDQVNAISSGAAAAAPQDPSDFSWSRPENAAPRPPPASPVSGLLATPKILLTPSASPVQAPTDAAAQAPRNLSLTLQDAALSTCDKSQGAESKVHMLERLTQQMQLCLVRLREPHLDDTRREKYQELASSIQSQIDKLTNIRFLSSPGPMGRRLLSSP